VHCDLCSEVFCKFTPGISDPSVLPLPVQTDTDGWVNKLHEAYSSTHRFADVLNRGYSGYNTRWALLQLPHLLAQTHSEPALATVFFGANDASLPESNQHVPIQEYQDNLEGLVGTMRRKWPTCPVILISPPPLDQEVWDRERGGKGAGMRTLDRTRQYAEAACKVAARLDVHCIDLFSRILAKSDWEQCLSDGLHLSASGNQELFQSVCEAIGSCAPHLKVDSAPVHFPLWSDMAQTADHPESLIPRMATESDGKDDKKRKLSEL
jgi:lysophospholipase L1-like esterase